MKKIDFHELENDTVLLAEKWQKKANRMLMSKEKRLQRKMKKILSSKKDKFFLNTLIDRAFRTKNKGRISQQINLLMSHHGIPSFLSLFEQVLALAFIYVGRFIPFVSVPLAINQIVKESRDVILSDEEEPLNAHLENRKKQGVRMNLNHLGEAILGEEQARMHLETYIEDLRNPSIENISVKISTIYSQITPLAFDTAVSVISDRLERLYLEAEKNSFRREDRSVSKKFVHLDMEAFQDLHITSHAFMNALDREELITHSAGIALQAYLPDSFEVQKTLTQWAKRRISNAGGPIRIRLVKGANLEMEKVEAAIKNWPLATYNNKEDVDACFKLMVEYALRPENIKAVNIGIASHNLFDLAWAYLLANKRGVERYIGFEMLEGMADHVRRAMMDEEGEHKMDMLLYAPITNKDQFTSAIAYLVRRLDENTGDENFLRYICQLKPGSQNWNYLKDQFIKSLKHIENIENNSFRIQNRAEEVSVKKQGTFHTGMFTNEPDTDWSLATNRSWADGIRNNWKKKPGDDPIKIPLVIAGIEVRENKTLRKCHDRSIMNSDQHLVCVAESLLAEEDDIIKAVETADRDPDEWRSKTLHERHEILSNVAAEIRRARGDLLGAAASGTGKLFGDADVEVSEAIDFVEYYPESIKKIDDIHSLETSGKGVGLVITPWNFPIAIPCGGIAAALASGNTVIFKPASEAILPAWELCQCFWRAGVSKNTLQFLPCRGDQLGSYLTIQKGIEFIIFTGGTDTAISILKKNPDIYFAGETGGKNATIVTAMADRDQAVKNVIHSAFGNAGQKCSATSLLILEQEVYKDEEFRKQLVDAAASLKTGSAWAFETKVGPLIASPKGDLKKALTTLEPKEEWALEPVNVDNNPYLWTPGIKWNVTPGNMTHMTEFFGPVLAVMCAKDLTHAISLANQTGYGLTSGLESLDEDEQDYWAKSIKAGNLYINRSTTGAIVLRQPFGGIGKSSVGAGIKAGGPNYALQFMNVKDATFPVSDAVELKTHLLELMDEWQVQLTSNRLEIEETEAMRIIAAVKNYHFTFDREFSRPKDFFHLRGQDNIFKYYPVGVVVIRIHEKDSLFETLARIAATVVTGCSCIISIPEALTNTVVSFFNTSDGKKFIGNIEILHQNDHELKAMMDKADRIRYANPDRVSIDIAKAAAVKGYYISTTHVVMEGRIELMQYLREQSLCCDYHRYGNIGERAV